MALSMVLGFAAGLEVITQASIPLLKLPVGDVPVSPQNPLFDADGNPFITWPSDELVAEVRSAGCEWAWRRQQHESTPLDEVCNAIITPFLKSSPGAPLGLLASLIKDGLFIPTPLSEAYDDFEALLTDVRYVDSGVSPHTLMTNLSSLGWRDPAPHMLRPLQGLPKDDLVFLATHGPNGFPYLFHTAGQWAMVTVTEMSSWNGASLTTDEVGKLASELWLVLGHHFWQGDLNLKKIHAYNMTYMDDFMEAFSRSLFIHGLHSSTWSVVEGKFDEDVAEFATAGQGIWDVIDYLCSDVATVDYSLFTICSHGAGHTLTWWYTSGKNTIAEAVGACSLITTDLRIPQECAAGFFHEMGNSNSWRSQAPLTVGENFYPAGKAAPCDYDDVTALTTQFACYAELVRNGGIGNTFPAHRFCPTTWWEVVDDETNSSQAIWQLSSDGIQGWLDSISFCYGSPYPGYKPVNQAACLVATTDWMQTSSWVYLLTAVAEHTDKTLKVRSMPAQYTRPATAHKTSTSDEVAMPRLSNKGKETLADNANNWDVGLCESAADQATFAAWITCVHVASVIGLEHDSSGYATDLYYSSPDPWAAFVHGSDDGSEELGAAESCLQRWDRSFFESGTERQLDFVERLCVDTALSHKATFQPTIDWFNVDAEYWATELSSWSTTRLDLAGYYEMRRAESAAKYAAGVPLPTSPVARGLVADATETRGKAARKHPSAAAATLRPQ